MTGRLVQARDGCGLHVEVTGAGPAVMLAHGLGQDARIWEAMLPHLPGGLRVICYDARGHGRSDVPDPPYAMGQLVSDAEAVADALSVRDAVFVGIGLGGMVAQALAVKRPDRVRALILSNTAVKMGTAQGWRDRIAKVSEGGLQAVVDREITRCFAPRFADRALWRDRLMQQSVAGYLGTCAALAGTDLLTPTSGLRLPTLVLAGDRDGITPPDMARDLADLIPGSRFTLLRGVGHLPPVEAPEAFAAELAGFLTAIAH